MNLGARTARAGISHLPEIVVLITQKYMIFRQMLKPSLTSLLIEAGSILGTSFENRGVEQALVYLIHLCEQFPGPVNGFGLEIVSETPVPQHLEHSVMVGVVTHLFEVIVLSAHAKTLLTVRRSLVRGLRIPQEYIFELVHTSIGKHKCRVTFDHHRGRRHDSVPL